MPLFGSKQKTPLEHVKTLRENFTLIDKEKKDKKSEKVFEFRCSSFINYSFIWL